MQLLGCLFSLLLVAVLVLLSFGFSILSFLLRLFGINAPRSLYDRPKSAEEPRPSESPKRVFEDGEGEYVDFEEV